MVTKVFAAAASAVVMFGLTACASSSGSDNAGLDTVTPTGSAASAAPSPTPQPVVTVTATATATAQPAKACRVADVSVKTSTSSGAAGTIVQRFIITNTSAVACTMDGHPFIAPYDMEKQGSSKGPANFDITVNPIPSTFTEIGDPGTTQTVAPAGAAVFFLKWSQVPVNDNKCPDAVGFDFRPPSDTSVNDNKLVDFAFTPCGTEMEVSNVFPPSVGG